MREVQGGSEHNVAFAAGSALFFSAFHLVLTLRLKAEVGSRWVSSVHAIVVGVLGIACCFEAMDDTIEELVWGHTDLASHTSSVFIGYLVYDLVACTFVPTLGDVTTFLHHVLFLSVALVCTKYSFLKFPFAWLIIGELSTPFVNNRWLLANAGLKETRWYDLNGKCLVASFIVLRVFVYGAGLFHLASLLWPVILQGTTQRRLEALQIIPFLLAVGWALNLFWTTKLLRGLHRHLRQQVSKQKKDS